MYPTIYNYLHYISLITVGSTIMLTLINNSKDKKIVHNNDKQINKQINKQTNYKKYNRSMYIF